MAPESREKWAILRFYEQFRDNGQCAVGKKGRQVGRMHVR